LKTKNETRQISLKNHKDFMLLDEMLESDLELRKLKMDEE